MGWRFKAAVSLSTRSVGGKGDPTGRSGTDVGQELDILAYFQLDRHNSMTIGYSKFFSGDFIREAATTAAARNANPELFYVQYSFRW